MTKEQKKWRRLNTVQLQFDFDIRGETQPKVKQKYQVGYGLTRLPIGDYVYLREEERCKLRSITLDTADMITNSEIEFEYPGFFSYPWHYECILTESNESEKTVFFSTQKFFKFGVPNRVHVHSIKRRKKEHEINGLPITSSAQTVKKYSKNRVRYVSFAPDSITDNDTLLPSERGDWSTVRGMD